MKNKVIGITKKIEWILFKPEVSFLLVAFLLIQLWFSKNLLFGGTESGVPTLAPGKVFDQIKWTWWEALGPGVSIPTSLAAIPLYAFMTALERIGFSAILIQKFLFLIIIYLQGLGASLLFRTIFPNKSKLQIMAGLFYIFNPFMMTDIWHRFIYTNFILSATLPFFILFYLQLIEKEKFRYIFYFLSTSSLAAYMFSAIAPAMAVWLAVLCIYLTAMVINRANLKKLYRITFLSLILFIFWIVTNLWWIYPLTQNQGIFGVFSIQSNVEVLETLSQKTKINYVVRGINPYNLLLEKDWGEIYQNFIFQFLSWIPFSFFLLGIITSIKTIRIWFMLILFIFSVFIAKGAADPLGFINSWLYAQFFILGAVKNPFEKLGLLVYLPLSIVAVIGVSNFWNLYKKLYLRILLILLLLGCGIYVWPIWSDKLFGSEKYPLLFKLPDDYLESSVFLSKELEKDKGKILQLPIGEGDSSTYLWSHTYNGVDLAHHIFPGSSISRFLYIPFVDTTLKDVARVFHSGNNHLYDQIFADLDVRYVVLNKDIDWFFRDVDDPKFLESKLDNFNNLVVLKNTEHLKIYKYTGELRGEVSMPKRTSVYFTTGHSVSSNLDFIWEGLDYGKRAYFEISHDKTVPDSVDQKIFLPKRLIIERSEFKNNYPFIPPTYYEKYLPDSAFYSYISIAEKLKTMLTPAYDKPIRVLLLTTKRLRESQRLIEQNKEELFNDSMRTYSSTLNEALSLFSTLNDDKLNARALFLSKYILRNEKNDLENLLKLISNNNTKILIVSDIKKIDEFNKSRGFTLIYPINDVEELKNKDSYSYQFQIKNEFKGNLIIAPSNLDYFGDKNLINVPLYINGRKQRVISKKINNLNWFDLGEIILESGEHEITIPIINNNNLVTSFSQFKITQGLIERIDDHNLKISAINENAWLGYRLIDYSPEEKYIIRFYYKVIKGHPPSVDIIQEKDEFNSPYNDGKTIAKDIIFADGYDFDWKYFETTFGGTEDVPLSLKRSTNQPIVRINVPIWNDCAGNNIKNINLCKDENYRKKYDKKSIVEFRDLKITKLVNVQLFLKNTQSYIQAQEPQLKYEKISPIEYQVEIDTNQPNFSIVLNESFHQGWRVEINNGKQAEQVNEKNHYLVNGYANGWFINQSGKLTLKIKFIQQEYFNRGVVMSIIGGLIATFLSMKSRHNV